MNYRYLAFILLTFFILSCEETKNKKGTSANNKKSTATPKKTKKLEDNTVLSDKNAVDFLTEYGKNNPENKVIMKTTLGDIHISLYEETPLHRANFIRLAKKDFYDETLFYRVVKGFVVQGGGSDDLSHGRLKRKIGKYTIPPEFYNQYFHKKGALAAARNYEDNPDKRSNPFDFYFVHGVLYDKITLDAMAEEKNVTFDDAQRQAYLTVGGAPHLDNEHTVFGEVTKGLDVIDEIAAREVGEGDWPLENVYINSITIVE